MYVPNLPLLSSCETAIMLQEMMTEVDYLLLETDPFWQDPENIVSYLYQAWGGLVGSEEIRKAITIHLGNKTRH